MGSRELSLGLPMRDAVHTRFQVRPDESCVVADTSMGGRRSDGFQLSECGVLVADAAQLQEAQASAAGRGCPCMMTQTNVVWGEDQLQLVPIPQVFELFTCCYIGLTEGTWLSWKARTILH